MTKKDDDAREVPDYEALTTIEEIEEEVERHKQILVGKDVLESKMKKDKKEYVGALNEQLKELTEEREHEIDVLSALEQRRMIVANGGGVIIPMPRMVQS